MSAANLYVVTITYLHLWAVYLLPSLDKNGQADGCYRRFAVIRARKIFAGAAEIAYDYRKRHSI